MSRLTFRTVTYVEGPEIDEWLERQAALDRAADERELVRWRAAYQLLGGTLPVCGVACNEWVQRRALR